MASRAILSNFFEEKLTQKHPQYLSRLSRALFPTTFFLMAVSTWKYRISWNKAYLFILFYSILFLMLFLLLFF